MPPTVYSDNPSQQPDAFLVVSTQLGTPPRSPVQDFSMPRRSPTLVDALRKQRNEDQNVKVHWHPEVIDNEHKIRARAVQLRSLAKTPSQDSLRATQRKLSSSSEVLSAKTSMEVEWPYDRRPMPKIRGRMTDPEVYRAIANFNPRDMKLASEMPGTSINLTDKQPWHPLEVNQSYAPLSKDPKLSREKAIRSTYRVPRAVPDASRRPESAHLYDAFGSIQQLQTPRPARLPTPDLPEMEGTSFCFCDSKHCKFVLDHNREPARAKMDAQSKQV